MKELPLRELLQELDIGPIQRTHDGWLRVPCPFAEYLHDSGRDKDPSFFAKIDPSGLSGFHCFTCHRKGRMSSLVRQLQYFRQENYGNLAIRADLAETPDSFDDFEHKINLDIDPDPINKAAYLSMYPLAWEDEQSRPYLIERGIGKDTTELLQLQYDPDEMRILFPVFDFKGELYGFSGRSILSELEIEQINSGGRISHYRKIRDYTGLPKEKLLLGEQLIDPKKFLWIVEGLFAFAHMIEIGARDLVNPIAILGSHMSTYQRDLIIDYNVPVHLCLDNDKAGDLGIYGPLDANNNHIGGGAYDLLSPHVPTMLPLYPEGKNDPDQLTREEFEKMFLFDHVS